MKFLNLSLAPFSYSNLKNLVYTVASKNEAAITRDQEISIYNILKANTVNYGSSEHYVRYVQQMDNSPGHTWYTQMSYWLV